MVSYAVKRLSRVDSAYLEYDPQYLSTTLLRFCPRPTGPEPLLERIAARAHDVITRLDAHPVLDLIRQRVRRVPGDLALPYWEDDPHFDIGNHIVNFAATTPVPVGSAGRLIADAMSRPLDFGHPLWRLEVIDCFDDGSFGLLATHHHAVADGASAYMALALIALDFTPEPQPLQADATRWTPRPPTTDLTAVSRAMLDRASSVPSGARRCLATLRGINLATATAAAARFAAYIHDEPPLSTRPPRVHTFADRRNWNVHEYRTSLLDLRLASRAFGVTITDLLLAAVAAAWPAVAPEAGEVWVLVPVSLHSTDDAAASNALGFAIVAVPCGRHLLETLRAASASLNKAKHDEQPRTLGDLDRLKSHLPGPLRNFHWGSLDRPEVVLSNMPGYPFRLYCQGGLLHNALASSSLCDTGWGKMTFITFDDVVYGTLLEDSGPDNSGKDFDKRFREALDELCRLGTVRTLLARQRHFAALSPSDIDRLTRAAEQVSFAAGDAILVACETADSYFVIESGSASVSVDGNDRRVLESGDSLGEIGLFRDGVRTATVTAVSPVEAVRIDKSAFIAAFRGDDVNAQPVRLIIDDYFDAMPDGA